MTPPTATIVVIPQGTSAITFEAEDGNDPRFGILARINTQTDDMTYRIVTRILGTGEKSTIKPDTFFDAMMAHFGGQVGGLPAGIHAIWKDTDPELVTNLVRFNAALAAGDADEAAAGTTFTGRMAATYGYHKISFGMMSPSNGTGPYRTANVYFRK